MSFKYEDKKGDSSDDKNSSNGSSNEVMAEWVVRAQLKIKQPKKKASSFGNGDYNNRESPCRVTYKWNSEPLSKAQYAFPNKNSKFNPNVEKVL